MIREKGSSRHSHKAGPMPTGTDTMANVTSDSASSGPSSPTAPAIQQSTRVLIRLLTGLCGCDAVPHMEIITTNQLSGVPWRTDASQDGGTVSSAQFGQYQAMLSSYPGRPEVVINGPLSADEDKSFNAFWAPFFVIINPTKTALEYFTRSLLCWMILRLL